MANAVQTAAAPTPVADNNTAAPPAVTQPMPAAPDMSGMAQPGPSVTGTQEYQSAIQGENTALQNVQKLAQPTPAAPPPPHARLLSMVQGLAAGLGAAGREISTHGREGGVPEVQQFFANQQNQKIQAQQAQTAQKNAQIQQQLMVADTNHKLGQNILLMAQLKNEMTKSDLSVKQAELGLQTGQVDLANARRESQAKWGVDPLADSTPAGQAQNLAGATRATQQLIGFAADPRVLGPDDPAVKTANDALEAAQKSGDVNAIVGATAGLRRAIQYHQEAVDQGIKQQTQAESAPFGPKAAALNDALLKRYQVLNPTAKALPSGYALDANSTPKDFDRIDKIMQQTENSQATKANRDIVNGMREEMMNLVKGVDVPGDIAKSGDDYIASLPVSLAGTIKAIHEGREAPPPAGSRSPAAQSILGALNHAYPDYDATKYPAYLDVRKKFTSGPEAKGINAINTVETHLSRMYDHATAPNTSGGITGKVTGFFGDKDVQALNVDATAVATELGKAYNAGAITEGEKDDWQAKLDFTKPGMTSGKLVTNIKEIDALLEGKQRAYEQQWSVATPSPSIVSPIPIINSDAASARAKIRGEAAPTAGTSSLTVTAPDGSVHTFKDQQGVDTFKKLAGIQ